MNPFINRRFDRTIDRDIIRPLVPSTTTTYRYLRTPTINFPSEKDTVAYI
jgi:hypothetical protein